MIKQIVYGQGSPFQIGLAHGRAAGQAVRANLRAFWRGVADLGLKRGELLRWARRALSRGAFSPATEEEIAGIAEGAGVEYDDLLALNLYHGLLAPEGCTVMMAVGSASATGDTIFAKNSDKVGGESLVGPNFYKNKEINVILFAEREDGHKIVGVSAAGTTGLKMGMNNKAMAAGTNIARTEEMYQKNLDLTSIRAADRAQLIRDGLEKDDPLEATNLVVEKLLSNPTATPGNVEFAGPKIAYIIEGSYDRVSVKKVVDDVDSRSNCFIVLKALNKSDDVSSVCRYVRTQEVLLGKKGSVTKEDMIALSMDHANGPGPNSICRHGNDFREETSLAAMVMELNSREPARSRFAIALGKPCHSWRHPKGHVELDMTLRREDIPEGFLNGETFKEFYTEEPWKE
ncbi:MAG: hypothetical protein H5U02_08500 [Clostridia bacterium]|nr:hypothetical protein [Clostridia bacterium]